MYYIFLVIIIKPPPQAIKLGLNGLNSMQLTAVSYNYSKCKHPMLVSNSYTF